MLAEQNDLYGFLNNIFPKYETEISARKYMPTFGIVSQAPIVIPQNITKEEVVKKINEFEALYKQSQDALKVAKQALTEALKENVKDEAQIKKLDESIKKYIQQIKTCVTTGLKYKKISLRFDDLKKYVVRDLAETAKEDKKHQKTKIALEGETNNLINSMVNNKPFEVDEVFNIFKSNKQQSFNEGMAKGITVALTDLQTQYGGSDPYYQKYVDQKLRYQKLMTNFYNKKY